MALKLGIHVLTHFEEGADPSRKFDLLLERYNEALGIDHFIMRVQWPGLLQDRALRTIDSLGKIFADLR